MNFYRALRRRSKLEAQVYTGCFIYRGLNILSNDFYSICLCYEESETESQEDMCPHLLESQAVEEHRRLVALVRSLVSPCGTCSGESDNEQVSSEYFRFPCPVIQ